MQLVQLHSKYSHAGLEILAFPCNSFGRQEPGTPEQIQSFVAEYKVDFPVMAKTEVNGPNAHPVYKFLMSASKSHPIAWNFASYFLINPTGKVSRFDGVSPIDLEEEIAQSLRVTTHGEL
eukprot:TRINITY_DN21651_c0_g3_i2.p2 TRINITY_DN21651_c0_g3~~TRINITY_DN21651_c0_g3_i2.p2  ORF type:complete len:120 (-),score=32.53 TRINITY_DN21651_c0_g3_i2:317-676(-)